MDYCECGSLITRGNCTNKGCRKHVKSLVQQATYEQIQYIKALMYQTGYSEDVDFDIITKPEASRLIDRLLEIKETGE